MIIQWCLQWYYSTGMVCYKVEIRNEKFISCWINLGKGWNQWM